MFDPEAIEKLDLTGDPEPYGALMRKWDALVPSVSLSVEKGTLSGTPENLRTNTIYKLGNEHFLQIIPDNEGKEMRYRLYKETGIPLTPVETLGRELCAQEGEFEYRLTDLIKEHGVLTHAGPKETKQVLNHLKQLETGANTEASSSAAYDAIHLLEGENTALPGHFAERLHQAAENKLDCAYKTGLEIDELTRMAQEEHAATIVEHSEPPPAAAVEAPAAARIEASAKITPPPVVAPPKLEVVPPIEKPPVIEPKKSVSKKPLRKPLKNPASEKLTVAAEKTEEAAAHTSGKAKWIWGGIAAATVAIGAYAMTKKKTHTEQEEAHREQKPASELVTPSV